MHNPKVAFVFKVPVDAGILPVLDLRFRGLGFRVLGFRVVFRVWDLGFRGAAFTFRVSL